MKIFNKFENLSNNELYLSVYYYLCLIYTFCGLAFPHYSSNIKNIVILLFIPFLFSNFKTIKKDILFKLLSIGIVIQIISWVFSLYIIPDYTSAAPSISRFVDLFIFLIIVFCLKNKQSRINSIFIAYIIGYLIAILSYKNSINLIYQSIINGARVDFGMHNAQHTSMVSTVVAMMSIYLVNQFKNIYIKVILVFVCIFSILILIESQSRQVWLGGVVISCLFPIVYSIIYNTNIKKTLGIYSIILITILSISQLSFVQKRAFIETPTLSKIVDADWENIPMTSIGIRVNSWIESIPWIEKSPIFGSGKDAVNQVIKQSPKFQSSDLVGFGHLHNYFIEVLVSFGIVGLIFIFLFYTNTAKVTLEIENKQLKIFGILFIVFWLIINNFESYNSKYYGVFTQTIVLAILYTQCMENKLKSKDSNK